MASRVRPATVTARLCVVGLAVGAVHAFAADAPTSQPALTARVDPRVELMSIIFRLAGSPEYNMDNSESPYADDVERHFGKFRLHAVVRKAKQMRRNRGVGYDAVMNLAVFIDDTVTLKTPEPLDTALSRMDKRLTAADVREFMSAARSFVNESDFAGFWAAHESLYATTASRMSEVLQRMQIQKWFDSFFGTRGPQARFELVLGLLNGAGNYGQSMRYADGRTIFYSIIGCWRFDQQGLPVFTDNLAPTIAHEFCHSHTNPLIDAILPQLEPAGKKLFAGCKAKMQRQAYGTWQTMMYESMVRACVIRYVRATSGRVAAWTEAHEQVNRGFVWVPDLADKLAEYETHRDRYPTLDAFMPEVVKFFDAYGLKAADSAPSPD